ncbi:MAG: hypothetical protein IKR79_06890, partial [Bacteroidales bacterium]|nr:hypothetical protein [Bacteroidales bacterium]
SRPAFGSLRGRFDNLSRIRTNGWTSFYIEKSPVVLFFSAFRQRGWFSTTDVGKIFLARSLQKARFFVILHLQNNAPKGVAV